MRAVAFALFIGVVVVSAVPVKFKPLDPNNTSPTDFWMPMWNDVPQSYCTNPRYPIVPTVGPIIMDTLYELYPNGSIPANGTAKPTNVWQKNLWGFNWTDETDWGAIYPYPYVVQARAGNVSLMYPGSPVNLTGNRQMMQGFAYPEAVTPGHPEIYNASYPYITMSAAFDLGVQILNGAHPVIKNVTDLAAVIEYQDASNATVATLYAVKGSPYVNIECVACQLAFGNPLAPPIIGLNSATPGSNVVGTDFTFTVAVGPAHPQGQTWHAYFSETVSIYFPNPPNKPLAMSGTFTGLLQIACGEVNDAMGPLLKKHSQGQYAKGAAVLYDIDNATHKMVHSFKFDTAGNKSKPLMMLALAHHMRLLPKNVSTAKTLFWCIKGNMTAVIANQWDLHYNLTTIGFGDELQVDSTMAQGVLEAAELDYQLRINQCPGDNDTFGFPGYKNMELYAYGRDLGQYTEIAVVLENLGKREMAINLTKKVLECMSWILRMPTELPQPCPPPVNNTPTCVRNMLNVYFDTQFGGLITGQYDRFAKGYCQCDKPGGEYACRGFNYCDNPKGWDGFANYGNAFYNDHHFQYGYIIRSISWAIYFQETKGANLNLNATVIKNMTKQALAFARDIANPDAVNDKYFTYLRHKDMYDGHSWAEGYDYSGRILTWVNQQSGGEAVNSYYSLYLLGIALNDTNVRDWGRANLATESFSIQMYQHLTNASASDKKNQPTQAVNEWGRCLSILMGNGASGATYYGPNSIFQCGITLLPITPFTREWIDAPWSAEAVDWMLWQVNRTGLCVFYNPVNMTSNPCPGQYPSNWTGNEWACCPTNVGYKDNQWRSYPEWFPYIYLLQSQYDPQTAWSRLQYQNISEPTQYLPFPYLDSYGNTVGYQQDLTRTAAYFHVATWRRKH